MFVPDDRDIQRAIRNAQPVEIDAALQIPLLAQIRTIVTTTGLPRELLESTSAGQEADAAKPEPKQAPSRTISQVMADLRRAQGISGPTTGPVQAKVENHYRPVSYNDYDSYEGAQRPPPHQQFGMLHADDYYDDDESDN